MIPWMDAQALQAALPFPALIDALASAFVAPIHAPLRHVHGFDDEGAVLLLMPAWEEQQAMGVKLVTVTPRNRQHGEPTVHSVFMLFDAVNGAPLALMDGETLTLRRTAAASALAARYLAREDASELLVVGHGALAPFMAAAHCAVRPIHRVRVWGRDLQRAQAALSQFRAAGLPAHVELEAVEDLSGAARESRIISCATTSKTPLLKMEWLAPGTHVDLVGGFKPDMREADDALMTSARVYVDTYAGTLAEAGDLRQPMEAGLLRREELCAELAELVSGNKSGRRNENEITLFKSVGTALEDLAAAKLAWERRS